MRNRPGTFPAFCVAVEEVCATLRRRTVRSHFSSAERFSSLGALMLLLMAAGSTCFIGCAEEDFVPKERAHERSAPPRDGGSDEPDSAPSEEDELDAAPDPDPVSCTIPSGEEYRAIEGREPGTRPFISHCLLAHSSGGGGMYIVESLTGVTEKDLYPGGSIAGFTYVQLRLVDPWFEAPEHPIARVLGGPFKGGYTGSWSIRLQVGQRVGVTFRQADPGNRNCFHMSMPGIFAQRADGSYSNEEPTSEVFADEAAMTRRMRELHDWLSCDFEDIEDAGVASPPDDDDAG